MLELSIDQRGSNLVRQVKVRPGSGIYQTSHPPGSLGLEVPQTVAAKAGHKLTVPYQLTRSSNRPDTPTKVSITAQGLRVHGDAARTVDCVGDRATGQFTLTGAPGDYVVQVAAVGDYNRPIGNVAVHIAAETSAGDTPRLIAGALLVFAAIGVTRWGAVRRSRSKKPQP